MKLIIGGTRGTNPVSRPDCTTFGGDTTSFLIEGEGGERILVDAGTGIRPLGQRLEETHPAATVLLLLSHYHLDHVMGFPSLSLLYRPHWKIEIASPVRQGFRVDDVMPKIFSKPFWPLQFEDLSSHLQFTTLNGETSRSALRVGGLEIRWAPLQHPGGATAYRVDEAATRTSLVIANDVEWAESPPALQRSLLDLAEGADALVMDGQFTPDEYPAHRGWGHSTWKECCDIARRCGTGRLLISHHAPGRNDESLLNIEDDARSCHPGASLARAGSEIVIQPAAGSSQQ